MQDTSGTAWYEREPDGLSIYSLVSEIKERIASITKLVKEEGTMIEYKDDGRGKRGPSSNTTTLPTLKPENMTFEKRLLRILATRKVNGRFGEQVALKVVYASQTWLWYQAITKSNPILSFLVDKFGADETAWPGNEVLLFLQHDEFDNRNRPAVELSSDKKKK